MLQVAKHAIFLLACFTLSVPACTKPMPEVTPPDPVVIPEPAKPDDDGRDTGIPPLRRLYISPLGSDSNDGLSSGKPVQTFSKIASMLSPGDEVNIMPGEYRRTGGPVIDLKESHSGTAEHPIVFKAKDPDKKPVLTSDGAAWNTVYIAASYFTLDGIEIYGTNEKLDYESAYHCAWMSKNDPTNMPNEERAKFNTNGINIAQDARASHVTIKNCVIHDVPGGGIGGSMVDYLTITGNVVYNCAWYTMYACSGISVIHPWNSDDETGYKIVISNNMCYNNKDLIPWIDTKEFRLSDGNGIIIDVNVSSGKNKKYEYGPYKGKTLVCNNLCFNNGGSGIHSYGAQNVAIVNNTVYHNAQVMETYGNIYGSGDEWGGQARNVLIANNISCAQEGRNCNKPAPNSTVVYKNNIYFGGTVNETGEGDQVADPKFVNPTTDPTFANFHLVAGSPAIGAGVKVDYVPTEDLEGVTRTAHDIGAYAYKNQ